MRKIYFKYQLVCRKYSCDKVWRINENEWQQYPIVGRKRFFIQEREGERWDESLKSENTVILVQITRTSPRRILSWKVEWGVNRGGENYVTTLGQSGPKWSEVVVHKSHNSYISNIQQMLPLSWAGVKIFQQEEKWTEKRYSASKGLISTLRRISKHFSRKRKEGRRRRCSTSQGEGFPPSLCTSHTFPDKHTIIPPHLCRQQKKKDMKQEHIGGTII